MSTAIDTQLQPLAPLARIIASAVQETPIRLGSPEGTVDLIQALIVRVAAYMGSELPDTPGMARHMVEVDAERQRQLAKWGDQHHPDGTGGPVHRHLADMYRKTTDANAKSGGLSWRDILLEEVHEALAEHESDALRAELVQCAAVIQAWISDIDRRPAP
jgi:hypothetical protein